MVKKQLLTLIVMCITTMSLSAQTFVKGDMNGDGEITVGDVTALVATATGSLAKETIDIDALNNSALSGEWVRQSSGDGRYIFYADGSTGDEMISYKYIPGNGNQLGLIYIYFTLSGEIYQVQVVHELTANQLVVSNYADYNHSNNTFGETTTYVRKVSVTGISVDPTTITKKVGETHQLTATLTPADVTKKYILWSSSNENVATVSKSGLVTIVGYGSCNIYAHTTDGSGLSATCTVSVPRLVESITLDRTSLVLHKDHEYSLNATASPANANNKAVTWSSSDTNIATVSADGTVTGKANGTATITCTAQDGSGVATTCTVTVPTPEYVDLGLPSGTLWATFNVGATTEIDKGSEFRWGETELYPAGIDNNSWSLYKYANGNYNQLTKYCTDIQFGDEGFTDELTELAAADDAATFYWGDEWCTPTVEQWQELINNCKWTTCKFGNWGESRIGFLVTSKTNSNTIFLSASGTWFKADRTFITGYYWSKNIDTSTPCRATNLYFNSNDTPALETSDRYHGRRIRPVHKYLKGVRPQQ